VIRRPPAFILKREKEDHEGETWSIWEGNERVGTLAGSGDTTCLKLWESSTWISDMRGACPTDKLQTYITSEKGDDWIHRARLREWRAP